MVITNSLAESMVDKFCGSFKKRSMSVIELLYI